MPSARNAKSGFQDCLATYYPEANPLLLLSHHEAESKTPAAKTIPVRIRT